MENRITASNAVKAFQDIQEGFEKALDELERKYYEMADNDPDIETVKGYLEQYGRLATDEDEIEESLVQEYECAQAEGNTDKLAWIYQKMNVIIRRVWGDNYKGVLFAILVDDGVLKTEN